MRTLSITELGQVSGGDWSLGFDLKIVHGEVTGTETIQDMARGVSNAVSDGYGATVDAVANIFTWWDPAGYYNLGCSGGGGR